MAGFLASAIGPGIALLGPLRLPWRDGFERALVGLPVGLAAYTFAFMALGWAQLLRPLPVLLVIGAGALLTVVAVGPSVRSLARLHSLPRPGPASLALLLGLAFLAYTALLPALGPEVEFDARWYHLAVPYHYALQGGFFDVVRVTGIASAAFPPYQETLYAGLIPILGTIAPKLLHWWDAVLAAAFLVHFCRAHLGSTVTGLLAALIFLGTPVVSWSMGTASNDLPLALLALVALHCYLRWRGERARGWLVAAGVVGGYSIGVKPFGAITLVLIAVAALYDLRRSPREMAGSLAALALPAAALCVPWLVRSYQLTGDPVFPALYKTFRTPYWGDASQSYAAAAYTLYGAQHSLLGFVRLPYDLTFNPDAYRSVVGPLFLALLPLVALALVRATATVRLLAAFAGLTLAAWFVAGALEVRYADGALPALAVVVAYAVVTLARGRPALTAVLVAVVAAATLVNSQLLVELQHEGWHDGLVAGREPIAWEYLYDGQSAADAYPLPVQDWINTHLSPRTDKVYDAKLQLTFFYLYSRVPVFDGSSFESPSARGEWTLQSADALDHLRREHVTYVAVNSGQLAGLRTAAIYPHLRTAYQNAAWDTVLLQVV